MGRTAAAAARTPRAHLHGAAAPATRTPPGRGTAPARRAPVPGHARSAPARKGARKAHARSAAPAREAAPARKGHARSAAPPRHAAPAPKTPARSAAPARKGQARSATPARKGHARSAAPARTAAPARSGAPARTTAPPQRAPARKAAPARTARRPSVARRSAGRASLLDRLLRGPAWVLCIGVLLAGIVFLNVSLLELNGEIARTDARSAVLKRENADLRGRVAELGSSERIQQAAVARGFVLPQPGDVRYRSARKAGDGRAATNALANAPATDAGEGSVTAETDADPSSPESAPHLTAAPATAASVEPKPAVSASEGDG